MVTEAYPEIAPEVAVIVFVYVPALVPAVNSPAVSMCPASVSIMLHTGVQWTSFPQLSNPVAVNCWVALMSNVLALGLTVIAASVPGLTVKVPDAPVFPEVPPVHMICCPVCATVRSISKVAVPFLVVVESGIALLSFFASSTLTVSEPVFMLLP